MDRTDTDETSGKRPRGMAHLASTLTGRTDMLARRSTEEQLAPDPNPEADSDPAPPATEPVLAEAPAKDLTIAPADPGEDPGPGLEAADARRPAAAVQRQRPSATAVAPQSPFAGPEGRLEASGETVVKWTLELAPQLVMALNVWERDETRRLGERVYRERVIDQALDRLPQDIDEILRVVAELPATLRRAPGQQFGTRVRASVRDKLLALRPELRVAGIKDVRIRDIYSAGVYQFLTGLGIAVNSTVPAPRNRATEKVS